MSANSLHRILHIQLQHIETRASMVYPGTLFMVVAPSGAGKSSLVSALLTALSNVALSVSCTTRSPRPGEQNGREYHFIDVEEFQHRETAGDFLEHAQVHGNWYGTPKADIARQLKAGVDVLLEIDWQGAQQVRQRFKDSPEVVSTGIFILPPSIAVLEQRLRARAQDSEQVIARRLSMAASEIAHAIEFEHVILNQEFNAALDEFTSVVKAARTRLGTQYARHQPLFEQFGLHWH